MYVVAYGRAHAWLNLRQTFRVWGSHSAQKKLKMLVQHLQLNPVWSLHALSALRTVALRHIYLIYKLGIYCLVKGKKGILTPLFIALIPLFSPLPCRAFLRRKDMTERTDIVTKGQRSGSEKSRQWGNTDEKASFWNTVHIAYSVRLVADFPSPQSPERRVVKGHLEEGQ